MNKHMTSLQKLSTADLMKKHVELSNELTILRKSVKLGDSQNYHIATTTRRELARVNMLLSRPETANIVKESLSVQTSKKEVSAGKKEKK